MLEVRTYGFSGMSRTKKAVLAVALVATGALLLTVGLVLLLALVTVGTVGALAVVGYRRLTGRPLFDRPQPLDASGPVRVVDVDTEGREPGGAGYVARYENDAHRRMISDSRSSEDETPER